MANNPYVNKVQLADGTTLIDISDTTAAAADVAQGKYFYDASGAKVQGTATGGGGSGGVIIEDTTDTAGGVVRTITAVEISGTKQITANGTGIDVTSYESVDVAVPSSAPNLQAKTNIAPSTSSQTITADSGYDGLSSVQIDAMPSGTAGTPTATKGTVSNHSVTVTPSVTNTTGYITGSTKTGTAVTVSASELVSGNKEITANGTNIDVSTYSTVSVAVSGVNIDTKTATATASTYPVSLEFTGMQGQPKVFSLRTTSQISSSGSTTYYYIANIHYNGTSTSGNVFRIGSTRRIDNVTSGYSWSYSGSTLTITSSAASRSASPGAFYSAYELVYVY